MNKPLAGALLIMAACLAACSSADFPAQENSIEVKQVRSLSPEGSPYVIVTATIAYTLASEDEGRVSMGLDSTTPGRIQMVSEQPVTRGTGTVELVAEIEWKPDRKILSAVFALDHKTPRTQQPPLAYRRSSVEYPKLKKAPNPPPAPVATASPATRDPLRP